MLKRIIIALFAIFILSNTNTEAQELPVFGITGVNTSEFPIVKSYIIAKNGYLNQDYYQGKQTIPNPPEFDLYENGVSQDDLSLVLKCDDLKNDLPVHIAMVVDASLSMFEDWRNGETRADALKRAVDIFIDSVNFKNGSSIFFVPFSGTSIPGDVWKDWNFNKADAKADFKFYRELIGRTDFNVPMYEEPNGRNVLEIFKSKPPTEKKVVVFLSDGEHDNQTGNNPFEKDLIKNQLQERGIQFYSITFAPSGNSSANELMEVSFATGGKYYDANNEEELNTIYREITDSFKSTSLCWLEWLSKLQCDEVTENNVSATFKRKQYDAITREFSYLPPADKAIASMSRDKDVLYFDNSGATSQEVTVTAEVGDFYVTGYTIVNNNNDFEIPEFATMPTNGFFVEQGNSKKFTVNYIKDPSDSPADFDLIFETDLCPVKSVDLVAPCSPETSAFNFGNVNLSGPTDLLVPDAFTNNSTGELSGTVTIEGANATEFSIKSVNGNAGNTFTLAAGESMAVEITITPLSTGNKTANLNYGIITDCGIATSSITANVIEADLNIPTHNWDLVRVDNPSVYNYVIENTNDDDVEIEAITLSDNTKGFEIGDLSSVIGIVNKNGGSASFDITFTPNVQGPVNVDLQVKLKNRAEILTAKLSGIGFVPEITGNTVVFPATEAYNSASSIDFVVENNSDYGIMVVKDIYLEAGSNPAFTLDKSGFTPNTAINKSQNITIPVNFLPTATGSLTGKIIVVADNIAGVEPVTFKLNEFNVSGTSIPGDEINLPLQEVGPILSCESTPFTVILENNSPAEVQVTGSLAQTSTDFALISTTLNIPANGSVAAQFEYLPTSVGTHNASARFVYSDGQVVNVPLQGTANNMNADIIEFSSDEYVNRIATYFTPSFQIKLGDFGIRDDVVVNELELTIGFNRTMLDMQKDLIETNFGITPLIDESDFLSSGKVVLTFNGSIPLDKDLTFDIPYQLILGNDTSTVITVDANFKGLDCISILTGDTKSITTGCNLGNTVIQELVVQDQGYNFGIVGENPVNESLDLRFELPFESNYNIIIRNSVGTILFNETGFGVFGIQDKKIDVNNFASGVYFIEFTSGPYTRTEKFIVVK